MKEYSIFDSPSLSCLQSFYLTSNTVCFAGVFFYCSLVSASSPVTLSQRFDFTRYLRYSSPARPPVLPVCVVLMPFAAERLGGDGNSGHPVANFLTSRMLLPHSEHSYQHPVVSRTAQRAPHIPAGLSLKLAIPLQL
jgi:hypothetical protein